MNKVKNISKATVTSLIVIYSLFFNVSVYAKDCKPNNGYITVGGIPVVFKVKSCMKNQLKSTIAIASNDRKVAKNSINTDKSKPKEKSR